MSDDDSTTTKLSIGGTNMTVELRGDTLHAEANTGNKQWVAILTDTHPQYNYDREFVAYQKPKTSNRDSGAATVADGAVIERVRYTHSGKNRSDAYYQLVDGEAHRIDEVDVEAALDGAIVADVDPQPEPRSLPDDAEPVVERVHECPQCGQRCASEHGVAVHRGIAHGDDEANETGQSADADDVDDAAATDDPTSAAVGHDGSEPVVATDGGQTQVKSRRDAQADGSLVREYQTPPGDRLYAYRSDDGAEHVVVCRGSEPATRWTERAPATVERPIPGQQRWTIPDNWEERVRSSRDDHAAGLYYVPESDVWARVTIPTNNWLQDAWYGVQAVGDLTVDPVGDLGSRVDVFDLADEFDADGHSDDAAAFRAIAQDWGDIETELDMACEWVRDEGIGQLRAADQPLPADENWEIEFHDDYIFRPGEHIDAGDYDIPEAVVLDELRDADLLPSHYRFRLRIDESTVDSEYYLRGLVAASCSPAEALDYLMTEVRGLPKAAWGRERDADRTSISRNASAAKTKLAV
jgi:hypothetical protein